MPKLTSRHIAALLAIVLALASYGTTSRAQQSPPLRVRGTITQIKGDDVTLKTVEGKVLTIRLSPDVRVNFVVRAKLSDIKPGRFVGTAARPKGDKWEALEVHIFAPGQRPGEGHRPWDPEPGATMTNADVTAAVTHAKGGEITLSTGGQSYVVDVPPKAPVVAYSAGTRQQVVKGAHVYFTAVDTDASGSLSAKAISVTKDPRYPPR